MDERYAGIFRHHDSIKAGEEKPCAYQELELFKID